MESRAHIRRHHQLQNNINELVAPEMRQRIRELKRELDEREHTLSDYFYFLNEFRAALDIARQSANCLLLNDPFEAWKRIAKHRSEEFHNLFGSSPAGKQRAIKGHPAKANIEKLITPQMRQQITEAEKTLDEYARCLDQLFSDFRKLKSFDTVIDLAEGLQCAEPLESWDTRKKREDDAAKDDEFYECED
jgi:hypothetical protein